MQKWLAHLEADAADEPEMLGDPPACLLDVVDRGVLEEAGDRVEPDAAIRVHVGKADAPLRGERPAD